MALAIRKPEDLTMKHAFLATFALLLLGTSGLAADLSLSIPESLPTGSYGTTDTPHIRITGEIEESDVGELTKLLKQYTDTAPPHFFEIFPGPNIKFDSNGGNLYAALEIGRILRQHNLTADSFDSQCDSACVFAFAGGVIRLGNRFGLHRPSLPSSYFAGLSASEAKNLYNKMIADGRQYLKEMGVSGDLLDDMLKVTSVGVRYVDWDYAERVSLVGQDPAHAEWALAQSLEKWDKPYVVAWYTKIDCMNYGIDEAECDRRYKIAQAAVYHECVGQGGGDTCDEKGPPGVRDYWALIHFKCSQAGNDTTNCFDYMEEIFEDLSKKEAVYQGWTHR